MPRMPMIAVAATPLLLLTLTSLLLLQTTTTTAAAVAATERTTTEEETTSFGDIDASTVTIGVDSDLILTTEDGMQAFTHLPENGQTTTEEPLPESVLRQLERERTEKRLNETTTTAPATTSVKNLSENLIERTTAAPAATATTEKNNLYSGLILDLDMMEDKTKASVETTTYLPQFEATATPVDNLGYYLNTDKSDQGTTNVPLEEYTFTSGPLGTGVERFATEDALVDETTWMQNMEEMFESTQATEEVNLESTPAPELTSRPTDSTAGTTPQSISPATEKPMDIIQLLRMMSSDVVTTNIMPESTTTEDSITDSSTTVLAEETTIAPPKQQSMLEAIVMTTFRVPDVTTTVESSTTTIIDELPETTTEPPREPSSTEAAMTSSSTIAPETTSTTLASSSTTDDTEDKAETTIEPPNHESMLAAMLMTTTDSLPETTTSLETTTSSTTSTSTTSTSTTSTSTTEAIPIVATRAPRVERIFNSDGVEVLYGYSSVVRTNGV
ncbi:hypothetical protein ACLKA7_003660 [Drosophila subpalustris]